MITRCPACETSFRITEAQLNTAKGAVRCGSCLRIFKAVDNLVPTVGGSPAGDDDWFSGRDDPSDGEPPSKLHFDQTAIDSEDDVAGDSIFSDDLLISDEMELDDDEESSRKSPFGDDLDASFFELDIAKPTERSLFDREIKPAITEDDDEQPYLDESWAMELLAEEGEDYEDSETYSHSAAGNLNADEWNGNEEDLDQPLNEVITATGDSPVDDWEDGWENDWDADEIDADEQDRLSLLSRIEPAPVEFAAYQGRNWTKTLLWGGLSTVGLALLAGQIAWFQFDSLSRRQPYRDLYAAVCPLIGCQLPSVAAPGLIRTSNLVVRSHPNAEGALMVDTILLNTAPFHQPYPDLVLTFSNIHGETLAARRFAPREYLAGELAGRTSMPSNQPVHLSLEIVDPGPDAVNYSAYIPR